MRKEKTSKIGENCLNNKNYSRFKQCNFDSGIHNGKIYCIIWRCDNYDNDLCKWQTCYGGRINTQVRNTYRIIGAHIHCKINRAKCRNL